jgi:hypothetical protein
LFGVFVLFWVKGLRVVLIVFLSHIGCLVLFLFWVKAFRVVLVVFLSCVGCLELIYRGSRVILVFALRFGVILVVFQVVRQRRG